ncbi:ABC transporter ATP-binding protein [Babesia caballi]|uniref:ABC transporter ATP-binding protein n=1 Tax=Babesia caballi TaxID=5871 RepID=A0AAV4LVK2_BABCB|nr:ABC transporter ATP-binding protein [Babesia caballi]
MRLRGHSLKELALMQFDEITKSDDYSRFLLSENIFTPDKPFNSYVAYMPQNYVSQLDDSTLVEKVISDTNRIYHTRLSIIQDIENHLDYLNEISDGRNVSEASIPQGENDAFDRPSIDWAKRILTIYNDDNQLVRETSRGLENVTTHLIDMFGMRETLPLKVGELSGGFKMRLCLLTQLIHSPQLLFLDEPTNNLDLASVTFLSKILKRLIGTNGLSVLLVSHSPSFLNSICTSIFQVPGDGTLSHHVGDFDNFVQKGSHSLQSRTSRLQHMEANLKKLQQEYKMKVESTKGSQRQRKVLLSQKRQLIEETEEMVNNMKDASKSAYSDVYEKCVLLNDSPTTTPKLLHHPLIKRGTFVFPDRPAFALRDVKLRNEAGEVLVSNLSLNIYNGDRVVILGNNGVGKSTLLTLLNAMAHASKMGIEDVNSVLKPRSYFHVSGGECQGGRNSDVNYFSQNCSDVLKSRLTVEMLAMKFGGLDMSNTQQLTDYLSTFHLHDFMNTNVCDLSFGERSRFILALQFLRDSAFLLLDEPSNHLDIYMQKTLHSLLNNVYTGGGIIVATHDLQLLQNLERVTTVLYIHEFDRLYTFNGDFRDEYIRLKHDTPDLSHEEIGAFLENCRTRYEPRICAPTVDPTSTPQTEEMTRRRLKRLKSFSGSSCKPGKPRIKNAKRYT